MTRPERTRLDDPTAENTAEQSTPAAGGLGAGRERDTGARKHEPHDDVVRRTRIERDSTPRRYEQPVEDDVMPADDPSLNTKI